jgi:hypothetical protein
MSRRLGLALGFWFGLERRAKNLDLPWLAKIAGAGWLDALASGRYDDPLLQTRDAISRVEGELAFDVRITAPDLGSFGLSDISVDQHYDPILRPITQRGVYTDVVRALQSITPANLRAATGRGSITTVAMRPRRRRRIGGPWPTSYSSQGYYGGRR